MKIRSYLGASYVILLILTIAGMTLVAVLAVRGMASKDVRLAEQSINSLASANYELSKRTLTSYGEKIVQMHAESAATEISLLLAGKPIDSYQELRKNDKLREIGTRSVLAGESVAGYCILMDRAGVCILHPNRDREGWNLSEWASKYPEMWELTKRSFVEPRVSGYFTFLDRKNRKRKKYTAVVHVPGRPFSVAALVNIDQYFLPAQERIKRAQDAELTKVKGAFEGPSRTALLQISLMALAGGAGFLLLGAFSGIRVASYISAPIVRLRDQVSRIGGGDFSTTVQEDGTDEIRQLAGSFNRLGSQLIEFMQKRDFVRDTFGRYLTQEVVNRLLESKDGLELGGENRDLSIIMSDLRGFTALTSRLPPEIVIKFLNRYLGKMVEILLDYNGVVDEIIGDGILAFFGAPEPLKDHPARAVACALRMQESMDEINKMNEADGLPHLEMGIAVNSGIVLVGNIGSEKRTKYGVVGSEVNFTGRMESYTVGGQVLISQSTYERLSEIVDVRSTLQVQMKGVTGEVTLYDVKGIGGEYEVRLGDRDDTVVTLREPIPVGVRRLSQKTVQGQEFRGRIMRSSMTTAILQVDNPVDRWEDLEISPLNRQTGYEAAMIYAKVVALEADFETYGATIRFTSVSSQAYKMLRSAISGGS